MAAFDRVLSGIPEMDTAFDNIRLGDNVVWRVSDLSQFKLFMEPYVEQAIKDKRNIIYFRFASHEPLVEDRPEIKENLDKIDSPQVLTLDEALSVFWMENGLNPKDYLQKTSENGQVYYQHKVDKNEIKVFVSLLYPDTENETENVNSIMEYGFYIIQTDGQNYFIGVNGEILPID